MSQPLNTQAHSSLQYHPRTLNPAPEVFVKIQGISLPFLLGICFRYPIFLLLRRVRRYSWRTFKAHVGKHTHFQANSLGK